MWKRLHREEDGFALVIAIVLMVVMTLLVTTVLVAGNSAFDVAEHNSRFTRTLGPAEAGVNDAVAILAADRTATSQCPIGSTSACQPGQLSNTVGSADGEYQVEWWTCPTSSPAPACPSDSPKGSMIIRSEGYYPSFDPTNSRTITRMVEAVYEPAPVFQYALFSNTTTDIKNNQVIIGDVWSNGAVTVGTNAVVCGSINNASGGVTSQNGAQIVQSYSDAQSGLTCDNKEGSIWSGGTIDLGTTGHVEGDATASAPAGTTCPPTPSAYDVLGGTVDGTATACGMVTSSAGNAVSGTETAPPATKSLPTFTFDAANYTNLWCNGTTIASPASGECDPGDPSTFSATAAQSFNALSHSSMQGTYVVWQSNPSQTYKLNLDPFSVGGDLTIITNAPVDFGNTQEVVLTSGTAATAVVISLYGGSFQSTTCDSNLAQNSDCSIYGQNVVEFDAGTVSDPDDGIAALLYTTGKMAFKNQSFAGDGAIYAGSMDYKNGFDIQYNSRIERILGFGSALQQSLWREIPD